jgi:hypothetical protein
MRHVRENRKAYRVLMGKPEGKRQTESPGRRWKNNIKRELKETVFSGMWNGLIWLMIEKRDGAQ